mmetsp:Transcript_4830/g.16838  ORF Transcript_4830/g.16838 Transcript_4830/m.16838 type:complete len:226 (-) Transcript_4830:336-1013(-)
MAALPSRVCLCSARARRVNRPAASTSGPTATGSAAREAALAAAASGSASGAEMERLISALEAEPSCSPAVARPGPDAVLDGRWRVMYSTAPPPSNGKLGPLPGTAFQEIDVAAGRYVNRLVVPPGPASGGVLTAVLDAGWTVAADDEWVVEFRSVEVALLGVGLFTKQFGGVTRVWRMTYTDEGVRVVRAARNREALDAARARGRDAAAGDDDDCVFLMVRDEAP